MTWQPPVWLSALTLASITAQAASLNSGIDQQLNNDLAEGQFIGAVVLVIEGDQSRPYSYGLLEANSQATPGRGTAFEIGSISKVFTTTLLAQQITKKRVTLDQTVGSLLGDRVVLDPSIAAITLKQLATHRSGLPRLPANFRPADPSDPYADYDMDDLLSYLGSLSAESLETPSAYSNLGSALLGQLLAIEAESTYERLLKEQILDPLGMQTTTFSAIPDLAAVGHAQGKPTSYWNLNVHNPAGGLISSLTDLSLFLNSYMGSPNASRQLAMTPRFMDSENLGIALGWQIRLVAENDPIYWHNGGTGGFRSMMAFRPATEQAIVLLVNDASYDLTSAAFIQLEHGGQTSDASPDYSDYVGHFGLTPSFSISLFERFGLLMAQATGQPPFELVAEAEDEFTAKSIGATIRFIRDGADQVGELRLVQNGVEQRGPRIPAALDATNYTEVSMPTDAFSPYLGRYELAPGMIITIAANPTHLTASLTGQPAYPIFHYETDRFFFKVVDAQLQFTRDDADTINGLILHQNGQQSAHKLPETIEE